MGERGVTVDHSTLNRWVIKYAPEVEKAVPSPPVSRGSELADG